MKEQVLSIEQMQELIELNFTPKFIHEFSSMMWVKYPNPYPPAQKENPTLIRLVPASGEYYGVEDIDYFPTFTLQDILNQFDTYSIKDFSGDITLEVCYKGTWVHSINGDNLLEIAFQMLKWCKENNFI